MAEPAEDNKGGTKPPTTPKDARKAIPDDIEEGVPGTFGD